MLLSLTNYVFRHKVSAEFSVNSADHLMSRLMGSGHVRVMAPHTQKHQIFISGNIRDRHDHILQLLDMHCNSDSAAPAGNKEGGASNMGYLVLIKHGLWEESSLEWGGDTIYVKPTAETTISLSQIEVRRE